MIKAAIYPLASNAQEDMEYAWDSFVSPIQMLFVNMVFGIWLNGEIRSNGQNGQRNHCLNILKQGHFLIMKRIHYPGHDQPCMLMIREN